MTVLSPRRWRSRRYCANVVWSLPKLLLVTASVGLLLTPCRSAPAAPLYRVTDLGVTAGFTRSFSYGLSDSNHYVAGWLGNASGPLNTFRWSAGTGLEPLAPLPGGTSARAFAVNDSGAVVGESTVGSNRQATLWQPNGAPINLGTLDNAGSSVAFGINDSGAVAGWSDSSAGTRAFLWTANDGMQGLGVLPGGTETRAYALNDAGTVVGWGTTPEGDRGFIYSNGVLSSLGALSSQSGSTTRAYGLSSNGYVAGDAQDPALGETAFLRRLDGALQSLGVLPGTAKSFGADVNATAQVVGWTETAAGEQQAFLWTMADGLLDLNSLLISLDAGWQLQRARSINEAGFIVGQGINPAGEFRAFLLSPIPAPSSVVLLATFGPILLFFRQRQGSRRR